MEYLDRIEDALLRVVKATARRAKAAVRRVAPDLEPAAYGLLYRLAEDGPIRVTELADRLGIDASTASRHVSRLEKTQMVERRPDPSDARAVLVDLTQTGRSVFEALKHRRRAGLEAMLSDWSADDLAKLAELLERLAEGLAGEEE
ncbi:MAG: hypothetical protein KatS3mg011_0535 [Acidimicrobiia bacterium]|nr:MAG: hypothetical protein KatS3mg011_0535 [Acidimicrobiia bacterium]